jgi:hypothetical protein
MFLFLDFILTALLFSPFRPIHLSALKAPEAVTWPLGETFPLSPSFLLESQALPLFAFFRWPELILIGADNGKKIHRGHYNRLVWSCLCPLQGSCEESERGRGTETNGSLL